MATLALLVVFSSSVLHVGWNVLAKGAEDKLAFVWLALVPAAGVGLVVLAFTLPPAGVLIFVVAGAVLRICYLLAITTAYRSADLSFVYPYSQGGGIVVAILGGSLVLMESPAGIGWIGMALTVLGYLAGSIGGGGRRNPPSVRSSALVAAAAFCIGSGQVVEKVGVTTSSSPPAYALCILLCMALVLAPVMVGSGRARRELARSRTRPMLAAAFMFASYYLALLVLRDAPMSYVSAARSTSVVVSSFAGYVCFRERIGFIQWLAILAVALGVICIGAAGS